jgi:hypothetical protein
VGAFCVLEQHDDSDEIGATPVPEPPLVTGA